MAQSKVVAYTPDSFERGLMGMDVTITLKNVSAALTGPLAHLTPKTYDLTGKIMQRPRGHERQFDCFGFSVPHSHLPMRVVAIRHVLAVNGIPVKHPRISSKVRSWDVKSARSTDTYKVVEKNGIWSCTCVANKFGKTCRHITEMKDKHG